MAIVHKEQATHWFYAVGPNCWGTGLTLELACKNAAKNWPRHYAGIKRPTPKCFSVWEVKGVAMTDCEVSDFDARLSWPKDREGASATKIQTSTLAEG